MANRRIFTVGFDLPGNDFEYVNFLSDQSLLDSDIVVFEPQLGEYPSENYNGQPLISESLSHRLALSLRHWRSELISAANAGKLVIVYLATPLEWFRYTGEKTYTGTGRSRSATNMVTPVSSYQCITGIASVVAKSGKEIRATKDIGYLASYWKEFAGCSEYEALIESKCSRVLLETKAGGKTVAGEVRLSEGGLILFLPPIRYDADLFTTHDEKTNKTYWTKDALKFGKKLLSILTALAEHLKSADNASPPPPWTSQSQYRLSEETNLESRLATISTEIAALQEKKTKTETMLRRAGSFRRLLYEQGHPLEDVVREALTLLGFAAEPFVDAKSEFDVVFTSEEGRFIGEVEGKDNRAINIDKFSQLERNLHEDFSKDDVKEMAKGVLFGNAFRLVEPTKRDNEFTAKCVSAAERTKIALVRTRDLFGPARYLKEHTDPEYAKACRDAILRTEGAVVLFPAPPISGEQVSVAEAEMTDESEGA